MTAANRLARNNVILLVCLLALILFYQMFEKEHAVIRDILLTGVIFSGIYSLEFSERSRKILLPLAYLTAITTWMNHFITADWMTLVDFGTTSITLATIVLLMVRHIARSRVVTPTIILNSVNGYVLLGLLGASLFNIANGAHILINGPGSQGIVLPDGSMPEYADYMYLSFITLTTVGYGDIIASSNMTRPVAILIGLSGQLYLTILIAMLVGKFLASSGTSDD